MDWIHCNDCFKQPHLNPDTVFVLTSCARIQCTSCNSTNSCVRRDCPQCRAQNYSSVTLDENMPTQVEDFFRVPVEHLKKYIKVHDFQRGHKENLMKHLVETRKKACAVSEQWQKRYSDLESKMETTLASERNLRVENSGLKEQNQSLQMQLKQYMDRDCNKRTDSRTSSANYVANRPTQSIIASQSMMAPVNNSRPIIQAPPPSRKSIQHHAVYQTNTGKKVFAPSTQSSIGPTRSRVSTSSSASQQPYPNSRQFLDLQTPSYVSSSRPNPQASFRNNNPLPTPIQQRPTTMTSAIRSAERRSGGSDLSQGNSYVNPRVHAFFSQKAQEALTPDIIRK